MRKRIIGYFAIMGVTVAVGVALGLYLAGKARWIPWGTLTTLMLFGLIYLASTTRNKPDWDPTPHLAGIRLMYMVVGLFAAGLVLAQGMSGLLSSHQTPPTSWIVQAGLAVMMITGGAGSLSWPRTDPQRGPYRWVVWFQIGVGILSALFAILIFPR